MIIILILNILVMAGYFSFWLYTASLVMKTQNIIYDRFPKEAENHLGKKGIFGINTKTGLLFLWEDNIKQLTLKDQETEDLRKRTVRCIAYTVGGIFVVPISIFAFIFLISR